MLSLIEPFLVWLNVFWQIPFPTQSINPEGARLYSVVHSFLEPCCFLLFATNPTFFVPGSVSAPVEDHRQKAPLEVQ
jgi:hypothetical protein